MAKLKASQGKTGTMFSNEEYQQYIERLKAISQPGHDIEAWGLLLGEKVQNFTCGNQWKDLWITGITTYVTNKE